MSSRETLQEHKYCTYCGGKYPFGENENKYVDPKQKFCGTCGGMDPYLNIKINSDSQNILLYLRFIAFGIITLILLLVVPDLRSYLEIDWQIHGDHHILEISGQNNITSVDNSKTSTESLINFFHEEKPKIRMCMLHLNTKEVPEEIEMKNWFLESLSNMYGNDVEGSENAAGVIYFAFYPTPRSRDDTLIPILEKITSGGRKVILVAIRPMDNPEALGQFDELPEDLYKSITNNSIHTILYSQNLNDHVWRNVINPADAIAKRNQVTIASISEILKRDYSYCINTTS